MILTFQNDPTVANWNDEQFIQNSMFSIHKGLANVQDIITPLDILKERKSQAEIVKNQKKEFSKIYTACLAGKNFEFIDEHASNNPKNKLVSNLLMVFYDYYKILLPTNMIGLLLSFTHLMGHKGLARMLANMESNHFETKYISHILLYDFRDFCHPTLLRYRCKIH